MSPPQPALRSDIREKAEQLKLLQAALASSNTHLVILFDSLDRLTSTDSFSDLVAQDVRAIRSAGIGVVLVGPLQTMFGPRRTVADRFDYFYHQPSVDVEQDSAGRQFMFTVLRRRADVEILPDETALKLVAYSGGVLRDLISLARAAGEEAYTAGADSIDGTHVDLAADSFGRTLLLGVDADELKVLQRVRSSGSFVPTSDKDIALLATRRVLEHSAKRFAVHPSISALLDQLAEQ